MAMALALCVSLSSQAQVQLDSGSARPVNPGAASQKVKSHANAKKAKNGTGKSRRVTCRDGTGHSASICRKHGGVA